jgi:hypothetical protein
MRKVLTSKKSAHGIGTGICDEAITDQEIIQRIQELAVESYS